MKRKQIKKIVVLYYSKLEEHIKNIVENFDAKSIHEFRIAVKKMRTFLRVISQMGNAKEKIQIPKKLKKAYSVLGIVRDLQLQQRVLKTAMHKPSNAKEYICFLRNRINKLHLVFLNNLSVRLITASKHKTEKLLPHKLTIKKFKDFIQRKENRIDTIILSKRFNDKNLHAVRKILKDIFYSLDIYKNAKGSISEASIWMKDKRYFNKLLDELGTFQDKCSAVALLNANRLNSFKKYDRKLLQDIKMQLSSDKEQMRQSLIKKLKPLPNKNIK